ncbi:FecR domain-containing protein [Spirosoma sp. BT702]|uniref:FecR domain-containing protein n=1 Tax=Spirosoma profusum TaxID=2771354 RepID=A0A926XY37_9BACT|nr:FecR domain-containing protein [Spirosoma profusum]MBD2702924.1 FecR domain-containing protein [Spirosoma profusum]
MENIVNKTVLFDYFSGRVSPLQKKAVEQWLAEPDNRERYYEWLHEWELSQLQMDANWQIAFDKVASDVVGQSLVDEPPPLVRQRRIGQIWLAVASVLLFLGFGSWLFRDKLLYETVQTGFGETRSVTLPDGSEVTLNANSSLRYARWFGRQISFGQWTLGGKQRVRTVELIGEADFSVRHLPDQQRFVVLTPKGLNVTVLGTQFTVFSRERNTRVVLRSGRVQLTLPRVHQRPLLMKPGDLATLDRKGQLALVKTVHPEAMASWKQHRFTFELTSLREIADMLHENYGLQITIKHDQLADRTISGSFPARDANEVLQLVAQLLQINYSREDNRVTFTD